MLVVMPNAKNELGLQKKTEYLLSALTRARKTLVLWQIGTTHKHTPIELTQLSGKGKHK